MNKGFHLIYFTTILLVSSSILGQSAQWKQYVLTPPSKHCFANKVHTTSGQVENPEALLQSDGKYARLTYPVGGEKPYVILDLGPSSPGGYPWFEVTDKSGKTEIRISYSDWFPFIADSVYGETGDFSRGSCTYLGVELPVPPGNPYRYELYTISGPGKYIHPMIQGQQRWVRIQLDTEGSSVDIDGFAIENVSDMSPYSGHFLCSDESLNRLWYASTYTAQIASFENSDAWTIIQGWLAPRGLARSNPVGLSNKGYNWEDITLEFDAIIRENPGPVSAVGWAFRAKDENNGYVARIDLDKRFSIYKREKGINTPLKEPVVVSLPVTDGVKYHIKVVVRGETFFTYLEDQLIDITTDHTFRQGRIGFFQPLDQWSLIDNVVVTSDGQQVLLEDRFEEGLDQWEFNRTLPFLADGAKRDRLPWIGDLDWIGRNVYYAFDNISYMKGSLEMFAFNQSSDGLIWATCYPENMEKPGPGEYGYYQSDEFSAWFVPTLADYLLFTADYKSARELFDEVVLDLDYLWQYVEGDGLHFQRYETSKGVWGHVLGQTGKGAYCNILICDAMAEGAFIAKAIGKEKEAEIFANRAEIMQKAIQKYLWDEDLGYYVMKKGSRDFCYESNALALAIGFPDDCQATRIEAQLNDHFHGKIHSLAIRGKFEYGFDQRAFEQIRNPGGTAEWLDALTDWQGPHTTWECMTYPPLQTAGNAWADLSHTDTGLAHLLSGYVLGVQPDSIGFSAYHVIPHTGNLDWAEGSIPTPHGNIDFSWKIKMENTAIAMKLKSPEGTTGRIGIPKDIAGSHCKVKVNNRSRQIDAEDEHFFYLDQLSAGEYTIDVLRSGKPE